MAYFTDNNNEQVRIDNGNNVFQNGKCINPKSNSYQSVSEGAENALEAVSNGDLVPGLAVKKTGHLSSFEYGHTRDEDGNPVCIKVCTGHDAWDLDEENDALIERSRKASQAW